MKIIYQSGNTNQDFDLGLLGESFVGMNAILKDFAELTGIHGEVEIRTTRITHGSVELYNAVHVTITSLPFNSPQELYDFLQVASPEMYREAREFFTATLGVRRELNEYFAGHAFDAVVLAELAKVFIAKAWKWAGKQKRGLNTADAELGEIAQSKARRLQVMVNQGKFRKVLKPITQGSVRSIAVHAAGSQGNIDAAVTEADIENYLPDEDQILPEFVNGTTHELTGVVQNLQSARGEIIKIRNDNIERRFSLITAKPHDGQTTEDYVVFYHQRVSFTAEVVRASMYKRPEFVIRSMVISQPELWDAEDGAGE